MTIEERKNVAIIKGSESEIDALKSKHRLERDRETCVVIEGDIPHELKADIPRDGYYKEKIQLLTMEKAELKEENLNLRALLEKAEVINTEQADRIEKLEKALIEAAIK